MNILCPTCQKQLLIDDKYAGMKIKCPGCAGMFNAPSLPGGAAPVSAFPAAGAPPAPPPPPTYNEPFKMAPEPEPIPPLVESAPIDVAAMEADIPPPPPPGDYTKGLTFKANPRIVPWIAPVGMTLIFILSFFPMMLAIFDRSGPNLWQLGFNHAMGWFLIYCLLGLIFGWPLSIVSFLIGRGVVPIPPGVAWLRTSRTLILLGVIGVPFLFLFFNWLYLMFAAPITTVPYKLIVRIHFIVLIGLLLEFWLERRKSRNLPEPKIEAKW